MHLVDKPALFPGACVCGNSDAGPFLDTGLLDASGFDRRIYLCNHHYLELLRVDKLVSLEEVEAVTRRLTDANSRIYELEQRERAHAGELAEKQLQLDNCEPFLQEARSTIRILEERIAALTADPGVIERQRLIAELTGRDAA